MPAKSKLTKEIVKIIRKKYNQGIAINKMADEYGVSRKTISFVINNKIDKY